MFKFPNKPRLQFQKVLKKSGWKYLDQGRHREVWRRGNCVIKIPLNFDGLMDNNTERSLWSSHRGTGYRKYASCRMVGNFLLLMEYAKFVGEYSDQDGFIPWGVLPDWCSSVDCCQVGYNRKGQIVAYDFGN